MLVRVHSARFPDDVDETIRVGGTGCQQVEMGVIANMRPKVRWSSQSSGQATRASALFSSRVLEAGLALARNLVQVLRFSPG